MNNPKPVKPIVEDKSKIEIEEIKKQAEENKNKYLRALADYHNFEKRVFEEKNLLRYTANKNLILKILPFLDNLDKAEIFIKDDGLKMIKDNFSNILKLEGLEEIDLIGKEYDPNFAEVVDMVEGKQDNIIVDVLRKGYKYDGQLIRIAQVKVSKKGKLEVKSL